MIPKVGDKIKWRLNTDNEDRLLLWNVVQKNK